MTPTEKTLELQITHEILTRADSLWKLISFATSSPRLMRDCGCNRPVRLPKRHRPPFANGLTLQDEGDAGWDVKINFPTNWQTTPGVLFLQFKRPTPTKFSQDSASIFHGSNKNPDKHCLFSMKVHQFQLLKSIANNPGMSDSVYYALPRISSQSQYKACLGRLILTTSFVKITTLRTMANQKSINIKGSKKHDIAIGYKGKRKELRSDPEKIEEPTNLTEVVSDIIATRVWRTLTVWQTIIRDAWNRTDYQQINWNTIWQEYMVTLAGWLAIAPDTVEEVGRDEEVQSITNLEAPLASFLKRELGRIQAMEEKLEHEDEVPFVNNEKRNELFRRIVGKTSQYCDLLTEGRIMEDEKPHKPSVKSNLLDERGSFKKLLSLDEKKLRESGVSLRTIRSTSYQLL